MTQQSTCFAIRTRLGSLNTDEQFAVSVLELMKSLRQNPERCSDVALGHLVDEGVEVKLHKENLRRCP